MNSFSPHEHARTSIEFYPFMYTVLGDYQYMMTPVSTVLYLG